MRNWPLVTAAACLLMTFPTSVSAQDAGSALAAASPFENCACVAPQPAGGAVATVQSVVGGVALLTATGRQPLTAGQSIGANSEVVTAPGASTAISVAGRCFVQLNPNQRMLLSTPAGSGGDICVRAENLNASQDDPEQTADGTPPGQNTVGLVFGAAVTAHTLVFGIGDRSASP